MRTNASTVSAPARPRVRAGIGHLAAAGLLWGTGGVTGTLLGHTAGLSALAVATDRLTVGGLLIVVFLTVTGHRPPVGRAAWLRIGQVGVLAALFQGSYFAAVSLTTVSIATLVTIGTAPVLVLVTERATGRRRADRRTLITVAVALAGLALLVGVPTRGFTTATVLASAALAVLASAGFATVTLVNTTRVCGLGELTTTGYGFTVGGLLLAPLAQATVGLAFHPTAASVALLLAFGTGPTAVAYTLYFRGLRTAPASTAVILTLLEPLTGTVLAALVLGDRLGPAGIAGAVLLAGAMTLAATAR